MKRNSIPQKQVTLTENYCVNAQKLEIAYLLEFDTDRLLAGFRETAGLDLKGKTRYGGWESLLIGGHTLGHYLTAAAQGYSSPNTKEADKKALYQKLCELIDGLRECQDNSKGKEGFLFGAILLNKDNVEMQFDHVEKGETDIFKQSWVPWYTLHKLLQGMIDVYHLTGYAPAKELASRVGDWAYNRILGWNEETHQKVLGIEYGGINDCLYSLYALTGKPEHAAAAHAFDEVKLFESVLAGGEDVLNNKHANTTIPKFIGGLNRYVVMQGREGVPDCTSYLNYAKAFWTMVTQNHTYITGGNSEWEHFGKDRVLDAERTNCNCETCNTYNMMKLSAMLYCITGEMKYYDYYENAYINTILSSQNPKTGMTTYFQAMASGYFKVYGEKFNKFWCCVGSGMENFTKLGSNLYFQSEDTVYCAQFISSKVEMPELGVTITQASKVLAGGNTEFTINTDSGNKDFRLAIRVPFWEKGVPELELNGGRLTVASKGNAEEAAVSITDDNYIMIHRSFQNGDTIRVSFHMEVEAAALPDADNVFAFRYGPLVLSALLGTQNMITTTTGVDVTIPEQAVLPEKTILLPEEAGSVQSFAANINQYMEKDADSMRFTLTGANTSLTFVPHYSQHTERYGLYWYFTDRINQETV